MFKTELDKLLFEPPPLGCVLSLTGLPQSGGTIQDRSPYGNNGTITGATWTRLPSGLWVLQFDGTDDYVKVLDHSSLDIINTLTLEAWIKRDVIGAYHGIIAKYSTGGTQNSFLLAISDGNKPNFRVSKDGAYSGATITSLFGATNLLANIWYHVVATYQYVADGTSIMKLYLNGVEDGTTSVAVGPIFVTTTDVYLGAYSVPDIFLDGLIGLPRIDNSTLNALGITNHYNQERHLFGV